MNSKRYMIFGISWLLLGLAHILLVLPYMNPVNNSPTALFLCMAYILLSPLVLYLRDLLLNRFLGLHLPQWKKATSTGTMLGVIAAIGIYGATLFLPHDMYRIYPIFWNILLIGFMMSFLTIVLMRLIIIWHHWRIVGIRNTQWLGLNLLGIVISWFAIAYYVGELRFDVPEPYLPFVGIAISEILAAYSYVHLKEQDSLKRKVEEV